MLDFGLLRIGEKRYDESEEFYKQVVPLVFSSLGIGVGVKQLYLREAFYSIGLLQLEESVPPGTRQRLESARRNLTTALNYARREGPNTPWVATILATLATVLMNERKWGEAEMVFDEARSAWLQAGRERAGIGEEARNALAQDATTGLRNYASLLANVAHELGGSDGFARAKKGFEVTEQIHGTASQAALAAAAARAALTQRASTALVRKVQDLTHRSKVLETQIYEGFDTVEGPTRAASLDQNYQALQRELTAALQQLRQSDPQYIELMAPDPISFEVAAKLLHPDDALISYRARGPPADLARAVGPAISVAPGTDLAR
jgi:hypothetical protein